MPNYNTTELEMPVLERLKAGDYEAWYSFHKKYNRWLHVWIHKNWRLPHRREGCSDIAQDVYVSLIRRLREGLEIEHMTAFVRGMALRKLFRKVREVIASKRTPRKEVDDASAVNRVEQPSPTPSQILIAREEYDRFMKKWNEMDRQMLELDLPGFSTREIAEKVGRCQRTVQLRLEKIYYQAVQSRDEQ